jgi:hypothetical protein
LPGLARTVTILFYFSCCSWGYRCTPLCPAISHTSFIHSSSWT